MAETRESLSLSYPPEIGQTIRSRRALAAAFVFSQAKELFTDRVTTGLGEELEGSNGLKAVNILHEPLPEPTMGIVNHIANHAVAFMIKPELQQIL